jgi:hypothetical protein
MAGTDAIAAVTEAIRSLLQRAVDESPDFPTLTVSIYQSDDLQQQITNERPPTLSVLLHRVMVSPARRNVPLRIGPSGERFRPPIPLDLFYLVIPWAGEPLMQQRLLGFAVRALEDTPSLPSGLLNDAGFDGTFAADEAVELTWAPLTLADEYDIWQVAPTTQQPCASYVARTVAIESREPIPAAPLAQTRVFDYDPAGPQ